MHNLSKIIRECHEGAILNLFVTPKANTVIFPAGLNNWRKCIEIKVCAPPEHNRANMDVIKTVADFFEKPVTDVYILSGGSKREKTVLVKGISTNFVTDRLRESLDGL